MKQKIVIKVSMHCWKCHSKAMKIAVSVPGVESVAIAGKDKDQVVVIGDGIDSVVLTRKLRKKVSHADLVSLGEDKNNKDQESKKPAKDDGDKKQPPPWCYLLPAPPPPPCYNYCAVNEASDPMLCIIL